MRFIITLTVFCIANLSLAQIPCVAGFSGVFPCDNFDMQSQITPSQMNASFANDSWGWTDPDTGIEYALVGLNNGTAFIELSNPNAPIYLGKLPTHTSNSTWRDVKVYQNYAFIVSEASGHGMQVFDLTKLRNVNNPPVSFTADAHYDGFGSAHNIVINTDTGFAYGVGTSTFNGGAHFVNIQDPLSPTAAGGYSMSNYSHDAQVVTYSGPDTDYTGIELLIGSNEDEVVLVDISDKNNPQLISATSYSNVGYTHQGWFTEDQRYFLLGDEFDESNIGFNSRTVVFDFSDLDNPIQHFEYFGPNPSIDHNGYVKGDIYYLANYTSGFRAIDISNIENQVMTEVGFFDTFPSSNSAGFSGTWNVYPFFESDNIVISGDAGFTLVKNNTTLNANASNNINTVLFPNPASKHITFKSNAIINSISVYNALGQELKNIQGHTKQISFSVENLAKGVYWVLINNTETKKLVVQ